MIRGAKIGERVKVSGKFQVTSDGVAWDSAEGDTGTVVDVNLSGGYTFIRVKPDHIDHIFVCGPRDLKRVT